MTQLHDTPTRVLAPSQHADVTILQWPEEAALGEELALAGRPRLFLVAPEASPPTDWDRLTDWVRLPADDGDISTRATVLQWRYDRIAPPHVDDDGVLRRGIESVRLTAVEACIMGALIDAGARIVTRAELAAVGWPDGVPDGREFDLVIEALRRRITVLDLRLHVARGRGYVLEVKPIR